MFLLHYIIPLVIFYFIVNKDKSAYIGSERERESVRKFVLSPLYPSPLRNKKGKIDKYKLMFWGLIAGNLIDLDHVYYRIIGKVGWFESACQHAGMQCSFGVYPLHSLIILFSSILIMIISFTILQIDKKKKFGHYILLLFWISVGIIIHFGLDYLHLMIGFGI